MDNKKGGLSSTLGSGLLVLICEAIVSLITVAVFFLVGHLDYTVVAGVALGSAVTVANYLVLAITVNRAIDRYMELRGTKEMTDEEAEAFASKHTMEVQNAASRSFLIRTVSMLGTLVAAFLLTSWFSPIATAVPLLMFRPVLYVMELIKSKKG